ncbi:unnamed protein product [Peniophora sp. CBMAI 1063]|nr:unnamed protein product [Peniophora sp. CBMAI 1063]
MLVKPGKYMDVSGRCNIEYLQNWARKSEGCHLLALVEEMRSHFSRDPPVYSKPKQPQPPQQDSRPSSLPSSPPASAQSLDQRPALPPKPPSSASSPPLLQPVLSSAQPPFSHHPSNSTPVQSANPSSSPRYQSPALPPKPPTAAFPHVQPLQHHSHSSYTPHHEHSRSASVVGSPAQLSAHPAPLAPAPGPASAVQQRWSLPPAGPTPASPPSVPYQQTPAPAPIYAPAPAVPSGPPPGAYAYTTAAAPTPAQSVVPALAQPVIPAPNLLDEDDDSGSAPTPAPNQAPPRPPNPELLRLHEQVRNKLAGELASLAHAHALDAERLRAHQRDLLAGEPAIRDESARLTAVRDVCGGVAARLRGAVQAAEANVAELRRKGDPPVDELVCAPSIVHNQLIDLVAEDNAIEDTIYHLHRALNAGRIDLDRFLRTTRSLAEEQFMKRALVEKIQTALPASRSGWS